MNLNVVNSGHDNDHLADLITELEIANYLKTEIHVGFASTKNDLYVGCRDTDIAHEYTSHSQTMSWNCVH